MDAVTMQQWLSAAARKPIRVVVTENRSLLLSFKSQSDGDLVVRVHRMFLDAPQRVHQALADWIQRRRGQARVIIRQFIHSHSANTQLELPLFGSTPKPSPLHSRGRVYDLNEIRDSINRQYF